MHFCFLIRLIGDCIIRLTLLKKSWDSDKMHCSMKNQCDWHLVLFYYFVELNIRSNIGHFFGNVTGAVITWWEDQCRPHTKIEDSKIRKYHLLFPRTRPKNGRIFVGTEKKFSNRSFPTVKQKSTFLFTIE